MQESTRLCHPKNARSRARSRARSSAQIPRARRKSFRTFRAHRSVFRHSKAHLQVSIADIMVAIPGLGPWQRFGGVLKEKNPGYCIPLGPPDLRFEYGYQLFSVCFGRGTLPRTRNGKRALLGDLVSPTLAPEVRRFWSSRSHRCYWEDRSFLPIGSRNPNKRLKSVSSGSEACLNSSHR